MLSERKSGAVIGAIDTQYRRIENALNLTAAGFIFALMFLATVQVLSRKLLNFPVPGYIDYAEQSFAIFAFLGVAYCQRLGGHVRMEFLIDKLRPGRKFWIAEAVTTFAALAIVVVLTRFSFDHFLRAWTNGDSTIDINLPVWPSKLLVSFALLALSIRLIIQFLGFLRLVVYPSADPVAVPLIADASELASGEAASSDTNEDAPR